MKKEIKIDLIAFTIAVFLCFVVLVIRAKFDSDFENILDEYSLCYIVKIFLFMHPKILLETISILFSLGIFSITTFYFSFLFFKRYLPAYLIAITIGILSIAIRDAKSIYPDYQQAIGGNFFETFLYVFYAYATGQIFAFLKPFFFQTVLPVSIFCFVRFIVCRWLSHK
jgi:hypothetical protein